MNSKTDEPIKLVIALYYYYPYVSGVSVYAKYIAEGLAKKGYDVTVLTSRFEHSLPNREVINGVKVVRRPVLLKFGKGVVMPTFWFDMVRYAWKSSYLNAHLPMAESGLAALFIPKKKLVTTYHCDIYLGSGIAERLITFVSITFMKLQLWRSRAIITNTLDYFEHSKMKRFAAKTIGVYPPVPDPGKVSSSAPLFKRLGIDDTCVKIGFVGRIVYEKGLSYLLEAIPYLRKELPDFKLILMGDYEKVAGGGVKDELDKYIEIYPENILFTGFLDDDDRNRFYAGLDVFVLPSIDPLESFGIVQVEALFGGAPVVASDMPGVREVVKKTGYGRVSKLKDPKDIAKQIAEVAKNQKRYKPNRSRVTSYFSIQKSIDAYADEMPR